MQIHPDNQKDYDESFNEIAFTDADEDHIGEVGALRLAKAMWWMLARMAGWEPEATSVPEIKSDRTLGDLFNDDRISLTISRDLLEIRLDQVASYEALSLYSLSGQLIFEQHIDSGYMRFETSGLPQGIYIISVSSLSDAPRSGMIFLH